MQLRISKKSEVPVHKQITEQIVFLIATGKLKPGEALPSVRELARRLAIHHNTVSDAYQELVRRRWLARRPGSKLKVCSAAADEVPGAVQDVDDFINAAIRVARDKGFSLQSLRERVRVRLLASPPDHILVVEQAPGLRQLLQEEIRSAVGWPVQSCSVSDLASNRNLVIGALVVTTQYSISDVDPMVPKERPAISMTFREGDEYLQRILRLKEPSVIAVVSISDTFLRMSRALIASTAGTQHTLAEFHLPLENAHALDGADLVFCDSVAMRSVKRPRPIHCRLVAPESLDYIASTMNSYQK